MKQIIKTDKAPGAIGPYSQGVKVKCSELVYLSGQIPLDPKTGELVGATAAEQCQRVMESIAGLLEEAGADLSKVIKTTIFLADMNDFGAVNEVYAKYFESDPPARACVEVSRLPKDVLVEIETIAAL